MKSDGKVKGTGAFKVGNATFGDGRLTIIAGPCVIESREHALMMARECARTGARCRAGFRFQIFVRQSQSLFHRKLSRAWACEPGLDVLRRVKEEIGVPVVTDVHDVSQVEEVAEVADILQIPAFLSRQTDLITAAAQSGRAVNVKKGQFLAPQDARNIVEKARAAGCGKLLLTERGVSFGYNNLVVDMRSFPDHARVWRARRLRCDAFFATARRVGPCNGRASAVHRTARACRSRLRSRRGVYGSPRPPGSRAVRWPEHAAA